MHAKGKQRDMICKAYGFGALERYRYVVVLSACQGGILLSRHRARTTWETQGGHIEPGETPEEAARRELFEESGAIDYALRPLCDYWAGDEKTGEGANGQVFAAEVFASLISVAFLFAKRERYHYF